MGKCALDCRKGAGNPSKVRNDGITTTSGMLQDVENAQKIGEFERLPAGMYFKA